jgi:EcoRII C terminal
MRYGSLSDHFTGIAAKRLSAVEVDTARSNQHEFNGTSALKQLLGDETFIERNSRFIWLGRENEGISDDAPVSWYDARAAHPTRTEWRLYFKNNAVMQAATTGDLLVVGRRQNGEILFLIAPDGSTLENQIAWLFGLDGTLGAGFRFEGFEGAGDRGLDFVSRFVLEELGVEPEEPETDKFDNLIERFGVIFPTSREFSLLARRHAEVPDPRDDPDGALMGWLEFEDALFRRLERHIVAARLQSGFTTTGQADVDGFLQFSLSVQNRRKSRMGLSFENHVEAALTQLSIRHDRGARTEGNSKPDFLFPGAAAYHDAKFDARHLTMLGVKSTLKDRWRQVLAEAQRIGSKHLLTIEPGISVGQTDEMKRQSLQLVMPCALHATFTPGQAGWLMTFAAFTDLVRARQKAAGL